MLSDKSFTLSTSNFQTIFIIDATRVGDVRVSTEPIMQTVIQRWGTGGGNVPLIYPIDDGREVEKHQNGTGIGNDGDPAYTLDRQQAPAVAMAYDEFNDSISDVHHTLRAGTKQSTGVLTKDVIGTLQARDFKGLNHEGARDGKAIIQSSTVRRLTPTECERLQGFPDGWTEGQADSHRYKQMGNAVAVPVVQWIVNRIVK